MQVLLHPQTAQAAQALQRQMLKESGAGGACASFLRHLPARYQVCEVELIGVGSGVHHWHHDWAVQTTSTPYTTGPYRIVWQFRKGRGVGGGRPLLNPW